MAKAACTEQEFIALWQQARGSAAAVSKILNVDLRSIYIRRRKIEARLGVPLLSHSPGSKDKAIIGPENTYIRQNKITLKDGVIVVFTDAHIFPGFKSTAQRALVSMLPGLSPSVVIDNGDSFDGGQISRHSRIGWDRRPTVQEELEANDEFHHHVKEKAKGASLWWNWGNHDLRYPTRLASLVPEFGGVAGFRLEDHFPEWKFGICLNVNADECHTMVKHRYRNGDHADWNNVMRAGINIVTGHDHQLGVRRFVDKRGVRYGVRAGTLSDANLPIFDYQEANPSQQWSGFAVLTFKDYRLMQPETVAVWDENHVEYRGKVYAV